MNGWRRNAAAFACGVAGTLTLPPVFAFPLLIPAFTGLFLLINNAPSKKRAFCDGWWWGWGFYISGLYWFCIALLTEPEKFAWAIPFALFGLTGVIALYAAFAALLAWLVKGRGLLSIAAFSVIWALVEYARGHLFTGFPWNLPGYSFAFSDASAQLAWWLGAYGLTLCAVWLGTVPAALADKRTPRKSALIALVVTYTLFAGGVGWGAWRLEQADTVPEKERYVEGVMLRLVQANITQSHKWDEKLQMEGLKTHMRLTHAPGLETITHIIWPETAVPYTLRAGSELTGMLGRGIPEGKLLITGALRMERKGSEWQIWNSVVAIDHGGELVGNYDKKHLVPFGEFLPFRTIIPESWLTPVGIKDFSQGAASQVQQWPALPPMQLLICYEAIFPELEKDPLLLPQWLLNLTNDAWFGLSSGPYQHFHMARLRAIELGLPLVRVANTGISAVTDSHGRILQELPLGSQGILDIRLPKPL